MRSILLEGNLAEWLRRKTRNLLGNSRVGSSPAVVMNTRGVVVT